MLEDLLLRMMDLQGYSFVKADMVDGEFHVWVLDDRTMVQCPRCPHGALRHDLREVTLTERPVLGHKTVLHVTRPRFRCRGCGLLITPAVGVQEEGFRLTHFLAQAVVHAARHAQVKFVAALYHLSWNTVRDVDMAHLKRKIDAVDPVAPNSIGIDEVSYRRGHKYLTVVSDQGNHRIIFVTKGRKAENLKEQFRQRARTPREPRSLLPARISVPHRLGHARRTKRPPPVSRAGPPGQKTLAGHSQPFDLPHIQRPVRRAQQQDRFP